MTAAPDADRTVTRTVASKVPEITAYFWITKVLITGMGDAASDYLGNRLGTAVAMPLAGAALANALVLQFRVRRYIAAVYRVASASGPAWSPASARPPSSCSSPTSA